MDEDNCMVDIAKFFLDFTVDESCGKCPPCRIGTKSHAGDPRAASPRAKAKTDDIEKLEELWPTTSRPPRCAAWARPRPTRCCPPCATSATSTKPISMRSAARPAIASKLLRYTIDPAVCKGCSLCSKVCPVGAISGEVRKPFVIDSSKCIKCGACMEKCRFNAISRK